ncbi:MAG TPA: hypothetical protein V6D09_23160 [Leptolyngbyaceae cyanobacterium]
MADNLNEFVDLIYEGKHQEVPATQMQIIGRALLLERLGQTATQIGKELNLEPNQVKEIVIRSKGWEETQRLEEEKERRSRYQ